MNGTRLIIRANWRITQTVVNAATGNQLTTYLYGTNLTNSNVASNELLRRTIYPDGSDTPGGSITLAYNRQGQVTSQTNQLGTVHVYDYDSLGRKSNDHVATVGTGVDGSVRRLGWTYEVRGMVQHVTSYNSAAGGSVVNDVLMVYNAFMQLTGQYQNHSGAATTGSTPVLYAYANGSANTVRLTQMTYPGALVPHYNYGTAGGVNDQLSRLEAILDHNGTTHNADYLYVGLGRICEVSSPQPGTKLTYIQLSGSNPTAGSGIYNGGDPYTGWDLFGRVIDQRWVKGTTDLDRTYYGYDEANNRVWCQNAVQATGQDEFSTYDGLEQLLTFQRGTLNGGRTGISGTPAWEEDFALDPAGNWTGYVTQVSGTPTLTQARAANAANEITTIDGVATYIDQDDAGNIRLAPKPSSWSSAYDFIYDAWHRLVKVKSAGAIVAAFDYDGQNWRITKTTAGPTVRHYYYTSSWQVAEERLGTSGTSEVQYWWGPLGVDNLICRDRYPHSERLFPCTNPTGSVTSVIYWTTGAVLERYNYHAYGVPVFMTAAWGSRASSSYDWDVLFDAYRRDADTGLYAVRNRYLHPTLGRWLTRDPVGYTGGLNLYAYVGNNPVTRVDAMGLAPATKAINCHGTCGAIIDNWIVSEITAQIAGWNSHLKDAKITAPTISDYLKWANGNQRYKDADFFTFNDKITGCGTDTRTKAEIDAEERACGYSVTLCGICIASSILGNLMYGLIGDAIGFSAKQIVTGATGTKSTVGMTVDSNDESAYYAGIATDKKLKTMSGSLTLANLCSSLKSQLAVYRNALHEGRADGNYNDLSTCLPCTQNTLETRHGGLSATRMLP